MSRNHYIDLLKFIAIVTMIIDHIGNYLLPDDLFTTQVTRGIGRVAMPLFFIVHGYLLAQLSHLPSFVRSLKFLIYASFLTLATYSVTGNFTPDILFYFVAIDVFWSVTLVNLLDKYRVLLLYFFALVISLVLLLTLDIIYSGLDFGRSYGVYPFFYSLAGLILGVSPCNKGNQNISMLLLVTTLSVQYNLFLVIIYSFIIKLSMIYYALPTILIPFLFWYVPHAKVDFSLPSPVIIISRNALNIYIVHLILIVIALNLLM